MNPRSVFQEMTAMGNLGLFIAILLATGISQDFPFD